MTTIRAVVGTIFVIGVTWLMGPPAVFGQGTYNPTERGDLPIEGAPTLGSTVVFVGEGFGSGVEVAATVRRTSDGVTVRDIRQMSDASGAIRVDVVLDGAITLGSYTAALTGPTVDGGTLELTASLVVRFAAPEPNPDPQPTPIPVQCAGRDATIVGTAGDDVLEGTPAADVIAGLAGNDEISGLGGPDVICAGAGNDLVKGGGGGDIIYGEGGRDKLRGNGGGDTIFGNGGRDNIKGNGGKDRLRGGGKADKLIGGGGNDNIKGNGGPDVIRGGSGSDKCRGGPGADRLSTCER